jgi:hypothetical protein
VTDATRLLYLLALRIYYDGSGKADDPACRFLNLGSILGKDASCNDLDSRWLAALEKHDAPRSSRGNRYFHSKEAMHNQGGYAGWNSDRVAALLVDLFNVLGQSDRVDPLAISCSINLKDYGACKKDIPKLRSPEAICLDVCFGLAVRHPWRDSGMELVFDRCEGFHPILNKVNEGALEGTWNMVEPLYL